jgi:hypothetical protein
LDLDTSWPAIKHDHRDGSGGVTGADTRWEETG